MKFQNPENRFHVKSEWQKNNEISTLWSTKCTLWKFEKFPTIHILRETNFKHLIGFEIVKMAILDALGNCMQLISRKFCVTEKLLNFLTVLQRVILYLQEFGKYRMVITKSTSTKHKSKSHSVEKLWSLNSKYLR